jgi:hypothetical protein
LTSNAKASYYLGVNPPNPLYCGDGIKNNGEECDGTDGVGVHQSCDKDCKLVALPFCGDSIKNGAEACDGSDGVGVHQSCDANCNLVDLPYCGDGIKNGAEECDGTDGVTEHYTCSDKCELEYVPPCIGSECGGGNNDVPVFPAFTLGLAIVGSGLVFAFLRRK